MTARIGFVLITHQFPDQITRLQKKLFSMFPDALIAWQHDHHLCPLPPGFYEDPRLIRHDAPEKTSHGSFHFVYGMIRCLKFLLQHSNPPDWIYFISGADYPVMSASRIQDFLANTKGDGFASFLEIFPPNQSDYFQHNCSLRLRYLRVPIPWYSKKDGFTFRMTSAKPLRNLKAIQLQREGLRYYCGSTWWTLRRTAAQAMVDYFEAPSGVHFLDIMSRVYLSDEIVIPTAISKLEGFHIVNNNLRFIDWYSPAEGYPCYLKEEDLPLMLTCGAHFARKFRPDQGDLLDRIDSMVETATHDPKVMQAVAQAGRYAHGPANVYGPFDKFE